jgi:hypothetical protein
MLRPLSFNDDIAARVRTSLTVAVLLQAHTLADMVVLLGRYVWGNRVEDSSCLGVFHG